MSALRCIAHSDREDEERKKNRPNKGTRVDKDTRDLKDEFTEYLLSVVGQRDRTALQNHLSTIDNPEIYLNRVYDGSNEQRCTLLMMACLNKDEDMVQTLLKYSRLDLEVLNDIQLLEKDHSLLMFENVTVLWAAAAIDNFPIVKLLIEHGAKINHTTKTNSTALRCACFNGNIDMARYLIENGADKFIAKQHNETNLIASVSNDDLKMTKYLLDELGCDVNECIDDGRSSLYIAVDRESLEHVLLLLDRGARNFRATHDQMSPILLAAEKRHIDLVNVISSRCSLLEQIEAEEMLGSAFACGENGACNLEISFHHFCQAIELRCKHNLPKVLRLSTVQVFNNRQECQTIDQLNELRADHDNLHVEALFVRERLLGPINSKYRHSLRYRGAVLADNAQHYRGITLWLYELELCRQYSLSLNTDDLRQWASIFSDMMFLSPSIPIVAWQTVVTVMVDELERHKIDFDSNLHTLLFLITIVSQVPKYASLYESHFSIQILRRSMISHTDHQIICRHVHSVVQRQFVTQTCGSSLLHMSLRTRVSVNDYFIDRNCRYPCIHTARLLVHCGADVNAIDAARNTPLHVFVSTSNVDDKTTIQLLCDAGTHMDCVNALGGTPIDVALNSNMKQFLKTKMKLNLKCLCARSIQKNGLLLRKPIARSLVKFVEKH